MRDDIHKQAPIPPALRRLLGSAFREADRQQRQRLQMAAAKALASVLISSIDRSLINAMIDADRAPQLFGIDYREARPKSRLQSELLELAKGNSRKTIGELLFDVSGPYITAICREAEAAMVANGQSRSDVDFQRGMTVFNSVLHDVRDQAAVLCIGNDRSALKAEPIQVTEALPLGSKARGAR
ncbi:MAG: hypothetical protein FD152_1422 [Xanthobacteraceae bacterium]|nr:MAG: hypothetical protein FD152_1422 [Xanthobacteraceae bacterium]